MFIKRKRTGHKVYEERPQSGRRKSNKWEERRPSGQTAETKLLFSLQSEPPSTETQRRLRPLSYPADERR